jgi:hypothetical protein
MPHSHPASREIVARKLLYENFQTFGAEHSGTYSEAMILNRFLPVQSVLGACELSHGPLFLR